MKDTRPFRAWCLSWDQDEDDGYDVVGYDIFTHDYNKRTPRGVVQVASVNLADAGDAAEAYADYVHGNCDGSESSWPLLFRVRSPDGTIEDFSVDRDFEPVFTARVVKQPETKVG